MDAWDAMTTDRPYRRSLGEAEAIRRLHESSGTQWDPRVVDTFLELQGAGRLKLAELPGVFDAPPIAEHATNGETRAA